MTSTSLALWIAGGVLLQLLIFLSISFLQHWQSYRSLLTKVADGAPGNITTPVELAKPHSAPAWRGMRDFRVTKKIIENAAQDICSLYLEPVDGAPLPPYLPGQFLTFQLNTGGPDAITRCYSLSDKPVESHYRISVKRATAPLHSQFAPGRSSSYVHDVVKPGDVLQVRAPSGHFHIDRSDHPIVLIGGGIGITPMLSMLNWCATEQADREVWLFYGARSGVELMAHAQLQALCRQHPSFHLRICLSCPDASDKLGETFHHHGRIDIALLRQILPLKPYHFYLCGPTPMMQSLVPALDEWGVPDARIHFEAFGPASISRNQSATPGGSNAATDTSASPRTVTFAKSGKQAAWTSESGSLLDLAESLGINISSGCRAGGCGTCQTTIQSGEVSYQRPPDCDPNPGNCLMCVCTPKTNVTLEL